MATHEHSTRVNRHLISRGPLFRRQQSIEFGERFGADSGHLTVKIPDSGGKLIDFSVGFARFRGVPQGLPALPQLLRHRPRGFAS